MLCFYTEMVLTHYVISLQIFDKLIKPNITLDQKIVLPNIPGCKTRRVEGKLCRWLAFTGFFNAHILFNFNV